MIKLYIQIRSDYLKWYPTDDIVSEESKGMDADLRRLCGRVRQPPHTPICIRTVKMSIQEQRR